MAYSGGRDSTALLHATLAAAAPLGIRVLALHVHHGLSVHADAWLGHCAARCRRWAARGKPVVFAAQRLAGTPGGGESIEAWARAGRYRALREMAVAGGAELVLLAHHRRDQAETFLLQALRGGGVAALSAMPRVAVRDGLTWARPWLDVPAPAIEAYLRRHRLGFVGDESNAELRFARSRLRQRVWPALEAAFPDAETALANAARTAQAERSALADVTAFDLAGVTDDRALDLVAWRALPFPRQGLALAAWLRGQGAGDVPGTLIARVVAEARPGVAQRWPAGDAELRSHRSRLRLERASPPTDAAPALVVDLSKPGRYPLAGWGGRFEVERVPDGGIAVGVAAALELRGRAGGERFQLAAGRPARSLKLQYQAAFIPSWQRIGPLVFHRGALVFVPGLGTDARALARTGEPQVRLA